VQFSVGYRLHFDPYHKEMMKDAADPAFGPFTAMTGDRGFVFKERAWRVDKKLAGGGPMMDLGIYIIHGACMAANGATPLTVTAKEAPKTRPELFNEVEEKMYWTMNFPGGAVCSAVAGFNHSSDHFKAEGPNGFFELQTHAFTYRGIGCVTSRGPLHFDPPVHQQSLQMDDFADCVATGRRTLLTGELGRRDIRILSAIYEAAKTGTAVTV
jgi:glucose-fructose oxidoreductase